MDRRNKSKIIEAKINRLRLTNKPVLASLLAYWPDALGFMSLCMVAIYKLNAGLESNILTYGPIALAAIALGTWLSDAYFERQNWKLDLALQEKKSRIASK